MISLDKLQYDVDKAKCFPGLTVIPIFEAATTFKAVGIKTLFGEAIESGDIKILESGSVPLLNVQGVSTELILGIKGTLCVGGGQDRQLRHSCIISKGEFRIPVQCVERGRWNPRRNDKFKSANSFTSPTLRSRSSDQGNVWKTINSYETMSSTPSTTKTYNCSSTLSVGTDREFADASRKYNIKINKCMADIRKRAQEMLKVLAQPEDGQIGIMVMQIDPLKWQRESTKNFHVNYIVETVSDSVLWQKIHRKVMEGIIYDTALLKVEGVPNLEIGKTQRKKLQSFLTNLNRANWKSSKSIGVESRQEFNCAKSKTYAEAIYDNQTDFPVHLVATSSILEQIHT